MATVLIVDDNPIDRRLASRLLEKDRLATCYAENGQEALEVIEENRPDLVVTDMLMPVMDGLELVERIKKEHPSLPVILMTLYGSEEIAVRALKIGAASYVPKLNLARNLVSTVRDVLAVAGEKKEEEKALACLDESRLKFVLTMQYGSHEPLVSYVQAQLRRWRLCDEADLIRVGTALHEALVNAVEHGSLELDSDLRNDLDGTYDRLCQERRNMLPYRDRTVHMVVQLTRGAASIKIRDEGPGFDPRSLPDPTLPENLEKISGRGLLLIRTFMDEVHFSPTGNEITMVKRKAG